MAETFRDALLWHIAQNETKTADLVRGAGVSRDIINKIKARSGSTTSAEVAVRIAAFYGMPLEAFLRKDAPSEPPLVALASMLTPEEERLVEAQVRGILAARGAR